MDAIKQIVGGICAPSGFKAAGMHCGIAKSFEKKDLALIFTPNLATAAAVYTRNKVKGAPIAVTRDHLANGRAQAIICNSGNANTCNPDGEEAARKMCELAAGELRIAPEDVLVASTGVIGQPLDIGPIRRAIKPLSQMLAVAGGRGAAQAIMTTDLLEKEISISFELDGKICRIGGIAKGSGMICPNMATMLAFLTTDANISSEMLQKALELAVRDTFNMVSVDGDTSTNDMAAIIANGLCGNPEIKEEGPQFESFVVGLMYCCIYLARMIAKDGEGATKLLECTVTGAPGEDCARTLAKTVVSSNLLKAAMFGMDANWGRVLCALGYADAEFDVSKVEVRFRSKAGEIIVCENGVGKMFNEAKAAGVLQPEEIEILVGLCQGDATAVAWGCDLTYDYVRINGDYRS